MLLYFIKSALVLSVMYVPYMLLLRKESFFRFNRLMLLAIMAMSLTLPLMDIHELAWGDIAGLQTSDQHPLAADGNASAIGILLNEVIVYPSSDKMGAASVVTNEGAVWWNILSGIYIIGMAVVLMVKLFQLYLLHRTIRQRVLWMDEQQGVTIYCHAGDIAPFSWMRSIVISENDYAAHASVILRHEMGHIRHLHSFDILLLNLCQIVQWANPFVWLMASSLRDVHEYEADDTVLRSGINATQYQNLLIKKAVGSSSYAFANSFNHSLLKKRITMMLNKKSNPWMRTKALYLIPVAVVALGAFATPKLINSISSETDGATANDGKVTTIPVNTEIAEAKNAETVLQSAELAETEVLVGEPDDEIFEVAEVNPGYKEGDVALMEMMVKNLVYPEVASENGVQGRMLVQFVVEKDGTLSNYKILAYPRSCTVSSSNVDKRDDITQEERKAMAEALEKEAIRVIKLTSGNWNPGKQKGKVVRTKYTLPITFRLS